MGKKENMLDLYSRCQKTITTTLNVDLAIAEKYKKILELLEDEKEKEVYREKLARTNEKIEYYQNSLKGIDKLIADTNAGLINTDLKEDLK